MSKEEGGARDATKSWTGAMRDAAPALSDACRGAHSQNEQVDDVEQADDVEQGLCYRHVGDRQSADD